MQKNIFSLNKKNKKVYKGQIFCDGGSRGNPGISGGGAVLFDEKNQEIARKSVFCGIQTNNFAEYSSLILGLNLALEKNFLDLKVFMDSRLVVQQMKGIFKIKNKNIKPLYEKAMALVDDFVNIDFQYIPREKNKIADKIANMAMDKGKVGGRKF